MKFIFSLSVVVVLLFSGCDFSNFDPVSVEQKAELSSRESLLIGSVGSSLNYDPILLPPRSPIYFDSIFTITRTIIGELGGRILLERAYVSTDGRLVTMLVDLVIPPDAFSGVRNITVTVDRYFAAVHCTPAMEFDLPLTMIQTFTGLNLSGIPADAIDFVYIKKDGSIVDVERTSIRVIKLLGLVSVLDAKINHFSKFGWVRKYD